MSYPVRAREAGREPFSFLEIDIDRCQNTYGVPPCMAGGRPCFNTRPTCQDPANYNRGTVTERYCLNQSPLPVGLDAVPCLVSVALTPTRIDLEGGLGQRATATFTLQDFTCHDRRTDPYWRQRQGGPFALRANAEGAALRADAAGNALLAQPGSSPLGAADGSNLPGTYWGRWLARNRFYTGRVVRVYTGYLSDPLDLSAFTVRTYVIEQITGPDAAGRVTIRANDPLKLADSARAKAPRPSNGRLAAALGLSDGSATLVPAGIGDAEYPASGFVRLGAEVCAFTRSGDALTLTRAQFGTDAQAHDQDETAQLCLRYSAQPVDAICADLLGNFASVPPAYLPVEEWALEVMQHLPRTYSVLVSEPTGVNELLKELGQQAAFSQWWDERRQVVRLRALRAPDGTVVLSDAVHLLEGSVTVTPKPELLVTSAWVHVAQRNATEPLTEVRNYRQLVINADLEAEGPSQYNRQSIRRVFARWIQSRQVAEELVANLRTRFSEVPREISFALDAKDAADWWTGDAVVLSTRQVQDAFGNPLLLPVQIIEAAEDEVAHRFRYVAQAYSVTPFVPLGQVLVIAESVNDVVLLDRYVAEFGPPTASTVVTIVIEALVTLGQTAAEYAVRTGVWPAGAQWTLEINGRIQAQGGDGGRVFEGATPVQTSGRPGGHALLVESPGRLRNLGEIYAGGGGGGAGNEESFGTDLNGGGGGAGTRPGAAGIGQNGQNGQPGTRDAGGQGYRDPSEPRQFAGDGGGPGEPGQPGVNRLGSVFASGGPPGRAITGAGLLTILEAGDIRGEVRP